MKLEAVYQHRNLLLPRNEVAHRQELCHLMELEEKYDLTENRICRHGGPAVSVKEVQVWFLLLRSSTVTLYRYSLELCKVCTCSH